MKIAVLGDGAMGRETVKTAAELGIEVVGVVEPLSGGTFADLKEKPDLIVDFSHPDNTGELCRFCSKYGANAVIGCTGHNDAQTEKINKLSESRGVVLSSNFSVGIYALRKLLPVAVSLLKDFDIEFVETHHRRKADAPSGTAKMLLSVLDPKNGKEKIFDRATRGIRGKNEIGVCVVRGGGVCGEHEILFLGTSETVSIKHTALDRRVFALGALEAARWLQGKKSGLFSEADVFDANGDVSI